MTWQVSLCRKKGQLSYLIDTICLVKRSLVLWTARIWCHDVIINKKYVRFEVFTAVTMKNGIFWDVMLCGSCHILMKEALCSCKTSVLTEPHGITSQKTPFFINEEV
jgi:hypothetical protein